jgi:hypothetical protein
MKSVLVAAAIVAGTLLAHAQSSMVIPLTVKNGNVVQVVQFGYSPHNTIGIDNDTHLGPFSESPAPPDPPEFQLEVRMRTIPGRIGSLGSTGTYKDFRDYRTASQVDTFMVRIYSSGSTSGLTLYPTTIMWPKILDHYASSWQIKTLSNSVVPPTDMLAADSVVIPADPFTESYNVLIIKSGANAASHPAGFRALPVSSSDFYNLSDWSMDSSFATGVVFQFNNSPGLGSVFALRFADGPQNVSFSGNAPVHVSLYRWVIGQTGLSLNAVPLHLNYGTFKAGITNVSSVAVYRRDKEGQGAFEAMPTNSVNGLPELTVSASSLGEFVFGSNDNPLTAISDKQDSRPVSFRVDQNYPNPFNPSTSVRFDMPRAAYARLKVYTLLGQEIATLVDGMMSAGSHVVQFNAQGLTSGVYFYRLEAEKFVATRSMILVK